jgi:hypothetical protein
MLDRMLPVWIAVVRDEIADRVRALIAELLPAAGSG